MKSSRAIIIVSLIVDVVLLKIRGTSGLNCWSCVYESIRNGSDLSLGIENGDFRLACKSSPKIAKDGSPRVPAAYTNIPCNADNDTMNQKEIEEIRANFIDAEIGYSCIQYSIYKGPTLTNKYTLDIMVRGCYGKKLPDPPVVDDLDFSLSELDDDGHIKSTTPTTTTVPTTTTKTPVICDRPTPLFWKHARAGELSIETNKMDTTNSDLQVCLCDYKDGCNDKKAGSIHLGSGGTKAIIPKKRGGTILFVLFMMVVTHSF